MALTNLRAVSGRSPSPVVETTTTRGAVSVFRSYYKIRVSCQRSITVCIFDLTHQQSNQVNFPSCCLYRITAESTQSILKLAKKVILLRNQETWLSGRARLPQGSREPRISSVVNWDHQCFRVLQTKFPYSNSQLNLSISNKALACLYSYRLHELCSSRISSNLAQRNSSLYFSCCYNR